MTLVYPYRASYTFSPPLIHSDSPGRLLSERADGSESFVEAPRRLTKATTGPLYGVKRHPSTCYSSDEECFVRNF